jgi:hypothetical protein
MYNDKISRKLVETSLGERDQMTLTLNLTADLEQRLIDEASRHGIPPDQFVLQVLAPVLRGEGPRVRG